MNNVAKVAGAAIKNNLRLQMVFLVCIGVVFICVGGVVVLFVSQFIIPELNSSAPDLAVVQNFFSLVLFVTSIISIGVYASVFSFQSLVREKARGNIQALLATPLTPRDIWLGKSLAAFGPGLVLAEVLTLAAFIIVNFAIIVPRAGNLVTPWMIVSAFLAVPLMYLALTLLVHIVGLTGKPGTANVIGQVFLPVVISAMINLGIRNVPSAYSWLFMVILLAISGLLAIITGLTRSRINAERIVLSG